MNWKSLYLWLLVVVFSFFSLNCSFGQGTGFQYQGQLDNSGTAANGNFDFQFTVYSASNGVPVSETLTNYSVGVTNGLFMTTLDFGPGIFTGPTLWLDIGVETNGGKGTNFTMLSPLQPILPVPYAIFANSASNLVGVLPASQLSGTLPASAFTGYTNTVALTNGGNLFSGTFNGNGAAVTNVNVTNLTGVLADSQLPINTAFLNSNQTFTASNTFNGANVFTNLNGNSFSGSFFGNGLVGWIVVAGTATNASIDHGYLLTNAQTTVVTLPTSANAGDIIRIAGAGISGWSVGQNSGQSILGNFLLYGKTWIQTYQNDVNFKSISCSPDGTKMAAAYSGAGGDGEAISVNSGQSWSLGGLGTFMWQSIAISADGTKIVIAPLDNEIYSSSNSGSSWTANTSSSLDWTGVTATSSGSNFVAVANGSGIYTNSGTTWVGIYGYGGGNNWTAISLASGGSELVAANSGVGIFASVNNGTSWTPINTSQNYNWSCIAASASATRMIAGVNGGGLYTSVNSGATFTEVSGLPTSAAWSGVASSSDGSRLKAVVDGGYIYTSANWGASWQTNMTLAEWSGVASSSDGSVASAIINTNLSSGIYGIYTSQATSQSSSSTGPGGYISGGQGSAVELQCIGNNQFMPVSFSGTIWAN